METADVYVLSKLRWQFFGSLTFRTERLPQRVRISMFFGLMRKAAKDSACTSLDCPGVCELSEARSAVDSIIIFCLLVCLRTRCLLPRALR